MGIYLFILLIIPLLIGLCGFAFSKNGKITLNELLLQEAIMIVIIVAGYGISIMNALADTEVWSGVVVKKEKNKVSCEHDYPCNPHSCNCDNKGNCSTCYDTCYDHSFDYEWNVYASTDDVYSIDRLDSQGLREPPRWTAVSTGEPTATTRYYENYLKANPSTVLRRTGVAEKYKNILPTYPDKLNNYYYCDRVLIVGDIKDVDLKWWNQEIQRINGELGAKKKVNIIVVMSSLNDREFRFALEEKWIGGKKNDFIIFIDVDGNNRQINWVDTISWTTSEEIKVELRDAIKNEKTLDNQENIVKLIRSFVDEEFEHRHIDDFKYLTASLEPGTGITIFLFILGIVLSIGLTYFFQKNETI